MDRGRPPRPAASRRGARREPVTRLRLLLGAFGDPGHAFPMLALRAAVETEPLIERLRPHAAVADILTPAPALAAERAGVPVATLIPHVDPTSAPGFPPYSIGARLPRTRAGRGLWQAIDGPMSAGL